MACQVCVEGLVGRQSGGSAGGGDSTPPHFCLSFHSVFSLHQFFFNPHPCLVLLPRLFFLWRLTLTASIPSLLNISQPHFLPKLHPHTNPFPSIRLPFLWLCVLRKKLIMFLISRVFQSPSKRDERETGRRETEVVGVMSRYGGGMRDEMKGRNGG